MICKNIKIKLNKQIVCKITNEPVDLKKCTKECKYYIPKSKRTSFNNKNKQLKRKSLSKSYKITKLERNRFSIITNNLDVCILCGNKKDNLHEIFGGRNRSNSMKYGLVIPLCLEHHQKIHKNKELQDFYHRIGQDRFIKHYPDLDFLTIFKKNYL